MTQESYVIQAYQVMEERTRHYSETEVSGRYGQVTSSVEHHSDQEIWVKSLSTTKEQKITGEHIEVRPGHKIAIAQNAQQEMLGVYNFDTADITWLGFYAHYREHTFPGVSIMLWIWSFFPGISALMLLILSYYAFNKNRKRLYQGTRWAVWYLLLAMVSIKISINLFSSYHQDAAIQMHLFLGCITIASYYIMGFRNRAKALSGRKALKAAFDDYIKNQKQPV